jgi:hypothetical protein
MKALELKQRYTLSELNDMLHKIPEYLCNEVTTDKVKEAIKLKENAIFKAKYFVTMVDKFMSGWGLASGRVNKLIIACESYEQAKTVERNAKKRNEMKYVNICSNKPQIKSHVYPSWKHIEDMGEIWTK